LLIAHLLENLDPHTITTLLAAAAGIALFGSGNLGNDSSRDPLTTILAPLCLRSPCPLNSLCLVGIG
ncbi:hypothetical protein, partial [Bradyrhizobium sp. sGM-13]|uniref:hypothetical protein n=1 Tax=Bradyrhizobium sp. sGM-13 TaxID=2831781 RepID=UPI001BCEE66C